MLANNGANVGVAAGTFAAAGEQARFYGLILPHGILELSAVVVAGAAGLAIGWAIIAPGDRPRSLALADEGRRSAAIILGLMLAFVVAGTIEGFVTPSGSRRPTRVAVGAAVGAAFWTYVVTLGRERRRSGTPAPSGSTSGCTGRATDRLQRPPGLEVEVHVRQPRRELPRGGVHHHGSHPRSRATARSRSARELVAAAAR